MSLTECSHCITKIVFPDSGICPACGKSKFELPGKSREEILVEQEKDELERHISYYKRRGPQILISGILITTAAIALIILTIISGVFIIWWYGGVLAGAALIGKGYSQIRNARELQFMYDKKFRK